MWWLLCFPAQVQRGVPLMTSVCGDDSEAVAAVKHMASAMGITANDAGGLQVREPAPLAPLDTKSKNPDSLHLQWLAGQGSGSGAHSYK